MADECARVLERPGGLGLVVSVVEHQRVFVGAVEVAQQFAEEEGLEFIAKRGTLVGLEHQNVVIVYVVVVLGFVHDLPDHAPHDHFLAGYLVVQVAEDRFFLEYLKVRVVERF